MGSPQTPPALPKPQEQPQVQVTKLPWRGEYVVQQYYEVTVDERFIEEKWPTSFSEQSRSGLAEDIERFQRMLKGLMSDQNAFRAVCDYLVLAEHDFQASGNYVSEFYGRDKRFVDILVGFDQCFTLEDREWLLWIVHSYEEEDFDPDLQVDGLFKAFQLNPSGFNVGCHACVIEDNT